MKKKLTQEQRVLKFWSFTRRYVPILELINWVEKLHTNKEYFLDLPSRDGWDRFQGKNMSWRIKKWEAIQNAKEYRTARKYKGR